MEIKSYRGWVMKYVSTFNLPDALATAMDEWEDVLQAAAGNDSLQLLDAVIGVLLADPARLKQQDYHDTQAIIHLRAITTAIRQRRAITWRDRERDDERGTCAACSGSGRIVVPHLKCVRFDPRGNEFVDAGPASASTQTRYFASAFCRCALGRYYLEQNPPPKRADSDVPDPRQRRLGIEEYERINPNWREQMEVHSRTLRPKVAQGDSLDLRGVLARLAQQTEDGEILPMR